MLFYPCMMPKPLTLGWELARERFMARVGEYTETGCRDWTASRQNQGYGQFRIGRRTYSAHRLAWAFAHGEDPGDLHVLHRCDRRICVAAEHLYLGTHAENMRDKAEKGRAVSVGKNKTHCTHGHEFDEDNTIIEQGQRKCRICKRERNRAQYLARRARIT